MTEFAASSGAPLEGAKRAALLAQLDEARRQGQLEAAIDHWKHELSTSPDAGWLHGHLGFIAELLNRRGIEVFIAGHSEDALAYFTLAYRARPDCAPAFSNAANCLRGLGRLSESTDHYRQALALDPDFAAAHDGFLMNLHYDPHVTPEALRAAHEKWGARFKDVPRATLPKPQDPDKHLHIGLVSADFGQHPVGYFLVRYLEHIDRTRFTVSTYADGKRQGYLADRLSRAVHHYVDTAGLSNEALSEKITADKIDILIDLSGHTADHRLGVFARKPAPVQIGWLGYPWENGLPVMDYMIGDPLILPQELQPYLQSRILHLPNSFVCFDPPPEALPPSPAPATANGYFTFGYFGSPAKCNAEVVQLWADVLKKTPSSRLLLKYQDFGEADCRRRFEAMFAHFGIASYRLDFQTSSPLPDLFKTMQGVDLALDPFPFAGGLMTTMTLWMGVPVLSLPGVTFASRQALSFLSAIGITDTIAVSRQDYIDKAMALSQDVPRLNALRQKLRPAMAKSSFCEGSIAAKGLEKILRQVWREKTA